VPEASHAIITTLDAYHERFGAGAVLVPTMGALHGGHTALMKIAAQAARSIPGCPGVVSTIFVNPTQFNDPKDLERYPRDLERDALIAFGAGTDVVLAPDADEVYPPGETIEAPDLPPVADGVGLEDAARPGFLKGVGQVCHRLFGLIEPAAAVFGEKDWQQLLMVEHLAERMHPGLRIIRGPTVREPDGLAMASRNRLLTAEERERAAGVPRAIEAACAERDADKAEAAAMAGVRSAGLDLEYARVVDAATCGPVKPGEPARIFIAARAGTTRLIDNHPWEPGCDLRAVAAGQREG